MKARCKYWVCIVTNRQFAHGCTSRNYLKGAFAENFDWGKVTEVKFARWKLNTQERWLLFTPLLVLPVVFLAKPAVNYFQQFTKNRSETAKIFPIGSVIIRTGIGGISGTVTDGDDNFLFAGGWPRNTRMPAVQVNTGTAARPLLVWIDRDILKARTRFVKKTID